MKVESPGPLFSSDKTKSNPGLEGVIPDCCNGEFSSVYFLLPQQREDAFLSPVGRIPCFITRLAPIVNVAVTLPADEETLHLPLLRLPFPDSLISFAKHALNLARWRPLDSHPLYKH